MNAPNATIRAGGTERHANPRPKPAQTAPTAWTPRNSPISGEPPWSRCATKTMNRTTKIPGAAPATNAIASPSPMPRARSAEAGVIVNPKVSSQPNQCGHAAARTVTSR
jgi:hypothetical protein